MIKLKYTSSKSSDIPDHYTNHTYRLERDDFVRIKYQYNGVGIALLGKPNYVGQAVNLTISPYFSNDDLTASEHDINLQVNQLVNIEIPCDQELDMDSIANAIKNFCSKYAYRHFQDEFKNFNNKGFVDELTQSQEVLILSCAYNEEALARQLIMHAAKARVPFTRNVESIQTSTAPNQTAASPIASQQSNERKSSPPIQQKTNTSKLSEQMLSLNDETDNITVGVTNNYNTDTYKFYYVDSVQNNGHKKELLSCELVKSQTGSVSYTLSTPNRKGYWTFGRGKLPSNTNTAQAIKEFINNISSAASASIAGNGFFKRNPFVRSSMDCYVSGFDEELKVRCPFVNFTSKAFLSMADQPVSFILSALHDLKYIDVSVLKEDSQDQNVYFLNGKTSTNLVAVSSKAIKANKWGDRSPLQWLVPNGGIPPSNSSKLIESLIDHNIIDISAFYGDKKQAKESISKNVLNFLADPDKASLVIGHSINDGTMSGIKFVPPMPTPHNDPRMFNEFKQYLRSRGITDTVIERSYAQRGFYVSKNSDKQLAISMVASTGINKPDNHVVQRFVHRKDGWLKLNAAGGAIAGTGHRITADDQRYIVLGEANIDTYSFLSLVEMAGGDITKYTVESLMAATFVPKWFERNFGVLLPKEGDDVIGYIVEENQIEKSANEIIDSLVNTFEQFKRITFVNDGTTESLKQLEFFKKVMVLCAIPNNKINIVNSSNREVPQAVNGELVFDRTCFVRSMVLSGLHLDSKGNFEYKETQRTIRPIENQQDIKVAKNKIQEVIGDSKFLLAFDNDWAGQSKSLLIHKFLNNIGITCRPICVPFEGIGEKQISHEQVISIINANTPPMQLAFCQAELTNDMNNLLQMVVDDPSTKPKILGMLKSQILGEGNGMALSHTAYRAAKVFEDQKQQMYSAHKDIYDLEKGLRDLKQRLLKKGSDKGSDFDALKYDYDRRLKMLQTKLNATELSEASKNFLRNCKKIKSVLDMSFLDIAANETLAPSEFNKVKQLSSQLIEHGPKWIAAKNSENENDKQLWISQKNQLIEDINAAFQALTDSGKQTIMKNPKVAKAFEKIAKYSNIAQQNNSPSLRRR